VVERIVDRVPAAYRFGLLAALALAAGFAFATIRQGRRARRAEAEALVDSLTGVANRRAFDRRLAEEWKRSERYGRPLGLVMLDLDGFKQLNDTRGHKEGDRVLREAASRLNDRLREIDLAARLGGDEFAALCPETPTEGLDALVHSLQRCLEGLPVGASIGYAERESTDDNPLDLLERADAAMYAHKNGTFETSPPTSPLVVPST
jgi:diguanylate cyclase (GGDEF)-like protein